MTLRQQHLKLHLIKNMEISILQDNDRKHASDTSITNGHS